MSPERAAGVSGGNFRLGGGQVTEIPAKAKAWALAVVTAGVAAGGLGQAAAAPAARPVTPSCPHVLLVAARGSGEQGPGTPGWKPTPTDPLGLGFPMSSLDRRLLSDLAGYPKIQVVSVHYPANAINPKVIEDGEYWEGIIAGVNWALNLLNTQAAACPGQEIVLAGYSQGGMVMHRVLDALEDPGGNAAILGRVRVVMLVGDGDQVPNDNATRIGTAPLNAQGVGFQFRLISGTQDEKFLMSGPPVLEVCNNLDPVCDFRRDDFTNWDAHIDVHLNYVGGPPGYPCHPAVCSAADQVARDVE
jgi:hypothetical protein